MASDRDVFARLLGRRFVKIVERVNFDPACAVEAISAYLYSEAMGNEPELIQLLMAAENAADRLAKSLFGRDDPEYVAVAAEVSQRPSAAAAQLNAALQGVAISRSGTPIDGFSRTAVDRCLALIAVQKTFSSDEKFREIVQLHSERIQRRLAEMFRARLKSKAVSKVKIEHLTLTEIMDIPVIMTGI